MSHRILCSLPLAAVLSLSVSPSFAADNMEPGIGTSPGPAETAAAPPEVPADCQASIVGGRSAGWELLGAALLGLTLLSRRRR